jgi:hypothetical protein
MLSRNLHITKLMVKNTYPRHHLRAEREVASFGENIISASLKKD